MTSRRYPLLLIPALLWLADAHAGMYRWVDENGVTVYSQTPPPEKPSVRIAPPPPPPAQPAGAADSEGLEQKMQKFQDRQDLKKENAERQAETERIAQRREQECQAARNNLGILEGHPRKLIGTPDGQYHRLTDEERQAQIDKAKGLIEEYCTDE